MPPLKAQLLLAESLAAYFPEMVFTDSGITVQLHRNTQGGKRAKKVGPQTPLNTTGVARIRKVAPYRIHPRDVKVGRNWIAPIRPLKRAQERRWLFGGKCPVFGVAKRQNAIPATYRACK